MEKGSVNSARGPMFVSDFGTTYLYVCIYGLFCFVFFTFEYLEWVFSMRARTLRRLLAIAVLLG